MPNDQAKSLGRRVLIVDDDQDFADSLQDLLTGQGYGVTRAVDPTQAIVCLHAGEVGVAMLDVRLGVSSGVDLLSRLKAEQPELICVMMTAHLDTQTAVKALRYGAYDYCDKSSEPGEIFAVLERCFERRQLQEDRRAAHEALLVARDEAELARAQAEAASRAKSEFLATMSHELRTPLNAIIGFSQMMMHETLGPVGTARYREYARDIHDSGSHLLGIINDILDLSRAEAGKLELSESWVDIGEAVEVSCRLLAPRAERAGLALKVRIEPTLPPVWADERKLKQVFLNLVSNAVKFTLPGGQVEVAAWLDSTHGVRVEVSDTGIGIARGDLSRVLEPFVQVESALSRRHQGSGLGLPLAAKMTEMHGGALAIESEPGRGTRVSLTLPLARLASPQRAANA
jgi:signal transduction histidine kinase